MASANHRGVRELEITKIFEMRQGRVIALIFNDQIILIDRQDPRQQISLAQESKLPGNGGNLLRTFSSVEKINENTLRSE